MKKEKKNERKKYKNRKNQQKNRKNMRKKSSKISTEQQQPSTKMQRENENSSEQKTNQLFDEFLISSTQRFSSSVIFGAMWTRRTRTERFKLFSFVLLLKKKQFARTLHSLIAICMNSWEESRLLNYFKSNKNPLHKQKRENFQKTQKNYI